MKIKKSEFEKILREELVTYLQLEQDDEAARELKLFMDHERELYNQLQSIRKNLINKKARGIYDPMLAVKLFMYLVGNGAKLYAKIHGGGGALGPSVGGFDKATRLETAKMLVQDFEQAASGGKYDDMLHKKYRKMEETNIREGEKFNTHVEAIKILMQEERLELKDIIIGLLEYLPDRQIKSAILNLTDDHVAFDSGPQDPENSAVRIKKLYRSIKESPENEGEYRERGARDEKGDLDYSDVMTAISMLKKGMKPNDVADELMKYKGFSGELADEYVMAATKQLKSGNLEEGSSDTVYELYETLKEALGAEMLLEELMQAMSSQEAQENLEHIAQMHDIAAGVGEYMEEGEKKLEEEAPPGREENVQEGKSQLVLNGRNPGDKVTLKKTPKGVGVAVNSQQGWSGTVLYGEEVNKVVKYLSNIVSIQEESPPGREDQVKKLKKVLPDTYVDKSGKRKESNPWAVAWSQYKRDKKKANETKLNEEDQMDKKCEKCKKGSYGETSQQDDMEGKLHCRKCGHETKRHK